ncbi:uncharacterized protein LOC118741973 [Rhagoletis pomonella]|uniref:uncharacterized protein LOC118741973 n=1 Tax=Rhagoletis pomonella TaxID=28610 RepID=UPI00177FB8FA|nr:uncharacterized protein LOC118741973 [Rhagoletis pomonella]
MTNCNKLNLTQKEIMADFMAKHPSLAKNNLPNSAQGRVSSNRLWEELSRRLNAEGPPVKDAKMWRKAFADQKYQAKKKLSFNKSSKQRTGGGPYQEKVITAAEEMIIEAAGLEVCVEGNKSVPAFGSIPATQASTNSSGSNVSSDEESLSSLPGPSTAVYTPRGRKTPQSKTPRKKSGSDEKLALLQENVKSVSDFHRNLDTKVDKLLETQEKLLLVQERMLEIKEEKHRSQQEAREIDLQIKRLELETL